MLKEKNEAKALEIVKAEGVDVNMPMDKLAELHTELEIATAEYEQKAAEVKKFNNEVYAPMCAKKAELEIRMHVLRIKLDRVVEKNPTFKAFMNLMAKQARKQSK